MADSPRAQGQLGLLLAAVDRRALIAATTLWLFLTATMVPSWLMLRPDSQVMTLVAIALLTTGTAFGAVVSHYGSLRLTSRV